MPVPDVETLRSTGFFDEEYFRSNGGLFWRVFIVASVEVRREMLRMLSPKPGENCSMGEALVRSYSMTTGTAFMTEKPFFEHFLALDEHLVDAARFDEFGYVPGKLLLERVRALPENPLPSPEIFSEMAELMANHRTQWENLRPADTASFLDRRILEDEVFVLPAILLKEYLTSAKVADMVKNNPDAYMPAFRRIVAAAVGVPSPTLAQEHAHRTLH